MTSSYKVSPDANLDLNSIWVHTLENWSEYQADKYYDNIFEQFEFIAKNFEIGKVYKSRKYSYRFWPVGSHLIFYYRNEAGLVVIARILHKNSDLLRNLT